MLDLAVHATQYEEAHDWGGEHEVSISHKFTDEKRWTEFAVRWRVPNGYDYSWLLAKTRKSAVSLERLPAADVNYG
jgi:hypothetical protein